MHQSVKRLVPPLLASSHKGQAGWVCVVGGCPQYTGAPFYAGMTALRMGCDLATVFCTSDAAIPIKSYSPELMVNPVLRTDRSDAAYLAELRATMQRWLPRMKAVVCGPGLGRNPHVLRSLAEIIKIAKQHQRPLILDGDALFLLSATPASEGDVSFLDEDVPEGLSLIRGYSKAILTPNAMEFRRLWQAAFPDKDLPPFDFTLSEEELAANDAVRCVPADDMCSAALRDTAKLAKSLGGVTLLRKGVVDLITDGACFVVCDEEGMRRRCGGQGDVLAGSVAAWNAWTECPHVTNEQPLRESTTLLATWAGSWLTRKCAKRAFERHARGTLTTDLLQHIGPVISHHFPLDACKL